MNRDEVKSIWGHEEESIEDFYTTKFLNLLAQCDYAWNPDDQETYSINLEDNVKEQFLRDFGEFVDGFDELQASAVINNIKEVYTEEYYRLLAASKKSNESRFPWFPLAHKIFRESLNKESGQENMMKYTEFDSALFLPLTKHGDFFPKNPLSGEPLTTNDLLSPTSEDLTDEDMLSPPSETFSDDFFSNSKDEALEATKEKKFKHENALTPSCNNSLEENPLLLLAPCSMPLGIEDSIKSNLLPPRQEVLVEDSLSMQDEAFIDGDFMPSLAGAFQDDDSPSNIVERSTFINVLGQADKDHQNPTSKSLTATSLSPLTESFSLNLGETSISSCTRTSISPTNSRTPRTECSIPPIVKGPAPVWTSILLDMQCCTSKLLKKTYSSEDATITKSLRCEETEEIKNMDSLRITERIQEITGFLSPAARASLSPAARASLSPAARASLSPDTRTSPIPVTKTLPIPSATSPILVTSTSSIPSTISPVSATRTSPSPSSNTSRSPVFKRTIKNPEINTSPLKQLRCDITRKFKIMNTSVSGEENQIRKPSFVTTERKLQPLNNLVENMCSENKILQSPLIDESNPGGSCSDSPFNTENTLSPASEVANHPNISSKTDTFGEVNSISKLSFCPGINKSSNMETVHKIKTGAADSNDFEDKEMRNIVQSAAMLTIENVKRMSTFSEAEDISREDPIYVFANKIANLLRILPPRLALESETFILHFLYETLKCSSEN